MYRIGDFSHISRVSIKMLRHYDELGLLKPAHIDPFTNYRYYRLDQLPRLNRIMALKSMGFALGEIRELLKQPFSIAELHAQAAQKRAELERELADVETRLAHLLTWMRRIEMENAMPDYEIVLKPLMDFLPPTIQPTEQPITMPLPNKAGFNNNILLPTHDLPAPDALASTIHIGDDEGLVQAYIALDVWVREHNYQIAGAPREILLQSDTLPLGAAVIEVQLPVKTH
jgi:DNA-binding transcriptional MerR regulator